METYLLLNLGGRCVWEHIKRKIVKIDNDLYNGIDDKTFERKFYGY